MMATASDEGLSWSSVKAFLTSTYPILNKNEHDITNLAKLIIGRESCILNHDDHYERFYSLFVALSTDAICSLSRTLPKSSMSQISAACKVLLKFLLSRLETPNRSCHVSAKYLMILIKSLCQGGKCLNKSDVETFTYLFKSEELPADEEGLEQETQTKDKAKEKKLSRLDTQKDLFDQMTSVFADVLQPAGGAGTDFGTEEEFQDRTPVKKVKMSSTPPSGQNITEEDTSLMFTKKNTEALLSMNGAEILLNVCSQLTFLSKYLERYKSAVSGKAFLLPATLSQALTLRNGYQFLLTEVSDVWQAFSLPVMEPLTPERLETIVELTMGCLFAAVCVATADTVVNVLKPAVPTGQATSTASGAKDDEIDSQGHCIVQKSLEMFTWVSTAIKSSTRAGGNVAQNFHLLAACVILKGIQGILALTPAVILERKELSKSKSGGIGSGGESPQAAATAASPTALAAPKRDNTATSAAFGTATTTALTPTTASSASAPSVPLRPQWAKGNQPFLSVTAVALANNAVQLMVPLLEDLNLEPCNHDIQSLLTQSPINLKTDIQDTMTAWERVTKLFTSVSLHDLLFNLISVSFRKAVYLKRLKQGSESQETTSSSSTSDSNTYYEDDFSTSEESSEDDDPEPLLGEWLDETLSPNKSPQAMTPLSSSSMTSSTQQVAVTPSGRGGDAGGAGKRRGEDESINVGSESSNSSTSLVPDKWEAEGFCHLVQTVLKFLNNHLMNSGNESIKAMAGSGITHDHVTIVASLTKELDKECTRTDTHDKAYTGLSQELARFNHILVASGCLTSKLENALLAALGVSPTATEQWALTVHPRTLAVLVSILLRKQQLERCNPTNTETVHNELMMVWNKFLSRLHGSIHCFETKTESVEDVNVEHLQVLLLLFHSLRLTQKKEILVSICNIIIQISHLGQSLLEKTIPLSLSRVILLMEYMMHYFYAPHDPPVELIEQVQHNLFISQTGSSDKDNLTKYFVCREVEENYRKNMQAGDHGDASIKPRFYNLFQADPGTAEVIKVDGLAVNCLLSQDSQLDYNEFYSACVHLLMTGSLCDKTKDKFTLLDACSMHYHFLLLWRLLSCLPPSVEFIKMLESKSEMDKAFILHTLRWSPRLGHKPFATWITDCLAKQGLSPMAAAELVENAATQSNTSMYDVMVAKNYLSDQLTTDVNLDDLPGISDILIMDAIIAKCQVSLDQTFTMAISKESDPMRSMRVALDLIPDILSLIESYSGFARSCILANVCSTTEDKSLTQHRLKAFGQVLTVGSNQPSVLRALGPGLVSLLPSTVRNAVDKWNKSAGNEFPNTGAWRNAFAADAIPGESYMDAIHSAHMVTLSGQSPFCINASLRHLLQSLVKFGTDLVTVWCPSLASHNKLANVMFPLYFDITTEYLGEMVGFTKFLGQGEENQAEEKAYQHGILTCVQILLEFSDDESGLDEKILFECIKFIENSLSKQVARKAFKSVFTEETDITSLLQTVSINNLSKGYISHLLKLFIKIFQQMDHEMPEENLSSLFHGQAWNLLGKGDVHKLMTKIVKGTEGGEDDSVLKTEKGLLQTLAQCLVREKSPIGEESVSSLLQALISMGTPLLESGSPSDLSAFPDLMGVLYTLAGVGSGQGHVLLFEAVTQWLKLCTSSIKSESMSDTLTAKGGNKSGMVDTLCCFLSYIGEILGSLKKVTDKSASRSYSPLMEVEPIPFQDNESEWTEEVGNHDEDDSGGEDSDEENLNNKLCTFTITQKEFMNQHWYHCHTCKMVDGIGVCLACAKVCHKEHDLTYARFGSFFCDCGAKQDGSCKALVKRTGQSGVDSMAKAMSHSPFAADASSVHHPSSLRRRLSFASEAAEAAKAGGSGSGSDGVKASLEHLSRVRDSLAKQMEAFSGKLLQQVMTTETVSNVLTILDQIVPSLCENYQESSPAGSSVRAQKALHDLHTLPKEVETTTDQLMTVTLGSQEGAFENVRMNFSGDQGQTIRQLMSSHMLRRVAMCVLSSPQGKRQHLAVSHEKGKMTILQLSALLKQADSSKKKLTLTRLSSAPVPFTVLSISGNPCNEDYLAVCGLKDCHVMTFTSSGTVANHLVLHPSLSSGNYIIKAVWLPGSQTELAIVTAEFVKIYDLGVDAISPQYYFLLPTGKIRDVTFVSASDEKSHTLVLMASSGYIYTQVLEDSSSACHGPFYITNVLEVKHADLKDTNGQVAGGGVSVYYSHALQLLFFSYTQGKSFVAPVAKDLSTVTNLFSISFKSSTSGGSSTVTGSGTSSSSNGKGGSSGNGQPLVSWSEVPGHTGLLYCMAQSSNNPVVLMVKPNHILMQEIKVVPSKAKIQDVVAIRHPASNSDQHRTTMILLCEDGSLRIYMANVEATNYWMSPMLQPQSPISVLKPVKKKKPTKTGRFTSSLMFPVDFFEHCQHSNDVEFGGNDVLQIYNVQQIKNRLNTSGLYIASTKRTGFTLEVTNSNNSTVMVGIRVYVGSQAVERAPSYIEVFGRTVHVHIQLNSRARWFDIPFTREESLFADKKFSITFGCSMDPASITMVDSVKVYVKTKEQFGWPEEPEDFPEPASAPPVGVGGGKAPLVGSAPIPTSATSSSTSNVVPGGGVGNNNGGGGGAASSTSMSPDVEMISTATTPLPMTRADRLLASALEVLDGAFATTQCQPATSVPLTESPPMPSTEESVSRDRALTLATSLLTMNSPDLVQLHSKALLASLFPTKFAYHNHKDQAQLKHVMSCLSQQTIASLASSSTTNLDVEAFQRLLVTARSVSISRPMNLIRFAESQDAAATSGQILEVTDIEDEPQTSADAAAAGTSSSSKQPTSDTASSTSTTTSPALPSYGLCEGDKAHFSSRLVEAFWRLHSSKPCNPMLAPACLPGLSNVEVTVGALVEVITSFAMCDSEVVSLATKHFVRMLLSQDLLVSFSCRQALIRVLRPRQRRRRVFITSPPHCQVSEDGEEKSDNKPSSTSSSTPPIPVFLPPSQGGGGGGSGRGARGGSSGGGVGGQVTPQAVDQDQEPEADELYEVVENSMMMDDGPGSVPGGGGAGGIGGGNMQGLENLWGMDESYPPMVEIPPDADDETMVELAIALSLQEQGGGNSGQVQQLANNLGINIQAGQGLSLQGLGLGAEEVIVLDDDQQDMDEDDDDDDDDDEDDEEENLEDIMEMEDPQGPGGLSLQGLGLVGTSAGSNEDDDDVELLENLPLSDTTASAPASDDEIGSTAATDGSTLRTSPAEHGGGSGGGSESGGSAVDSISATSGRSSSYGYPVSDNLTPVQREEHATYEATQGSDTFEPDTCNSQRLHDLRRSFLESFLVYFPEIQKVGGVRAIPFMQVLLVLTTDLEEEADKPVLVQLLTTVIQQLDLSGRDLENIAQRDEKSEVKLILLRLLSVLLSKSKSGTKHHGESTFVCNKTASELLTANTIPYCLKVLESVLPFWKNYTATEDDGTLSIPGQLLRTHPAHSPPDMSPFFLRQYVKSHANDLFEDYPQLLTEMVLRLPYQLKKIADEQSVVPKAVFDPKWNEMLSEYMLTQQTPHVKRQVRKEVRKLLLFLCGSKEKYRLLRDDYTIQSHLVQMNQLSLAPDMPPHSIILPYDTLLTMIEHLKIVCDIAVSRPYNWQTYCHSHQDTLPYLIQASIQLDEGVAPTLLQLLQCAICGVKGHQQGSSAASMSPVKQKSSKSEKVARAEEAEESRPFDESLGKNLVNQLNKTLTQSLLISFVHTYLLDSNSSSNRWMAHALVLQIYRNSTEDEQQKLLESLWGLWQELPVYGRKAAQFVDLLGYFVLKTPGLPDKTVQEYLQKVVTLLKEENQVLAHHPNATIYNMLQGLVDFDGYYLESDPCLVCNNPEVSYQTLKLSAVKVDSKFTTTTQIVKLVGSHTISKIALRISDLKKTKMVQTLNIYYNNRSVQAVVELRNRPGLWHKAKRVKLTSGQTEVKVDFPIPIVACNLMIEYADFYDNVQATSETLQCPRCSASVPASPGVCSNCGENVYQCHKCRSINYDEKDPFLCNSCGFCKYAKFDYTLTGKPCCAVDPIENEEDRKKAISSINTLLEKADRNYKQLQLHRPILESLLIQVAEHGSDKLLTGSKEMNGSAGAVPVSSVNKAIQLLAQKYCGECKAAFDELSKIIQKVMACRRGLVEYDQQQHDAVAAQGQGPKLSGIRAKAVTVTTTSSKETIAKEKREGLRSSKCFGCASAAIEHCITLLRALVTNGDMKQMLCKQGMIQQLIDHNLRHGALSVRSEVRTLLCLLTRDNRRGTEEMNRLIMTRIMAAIKGHQSNPDLGSSVRHEVMLLATSLLQDDSCWEQRTRCVMQLFLMGMQMKSPVIMESITLPCLRILQGMVKHDLISFINGKKRESDKDSADSLPATFHMDIRKWLAGDSNYSYNTWKKRLPAKQGGPSSAPPVPMTTTTAIAGASNGSINLANSTTTTTTTTMLMVDKKQVPPLATNQPQAGKKSSSQSSLPKTPGTIRADYLMEKYVVRWKQAMWKVPAVTLRLTQTTWLQQAMFSPSSRAARQTACSVVEAISQVFSWRKEVLDMLTSCLEEIGKSGECASEFLALYKSLIKHDRWKFYLAIKGVMLKLAHLITKEVEYLLYLEETTLSSDLAQGFALKALTELLALFVEQEQLKQHYKNRLVGCVLNGYLSLRKLVVQRTKLIDDTQERLLQMLEELTTGTESETKEFMAVCVQTVKKYPLDDYRSPVFIFERLCSIIYPEENDVAEFFLILEKDPQQEDFLQGRMLGNPYSSTEPGMGPLMRDIKNKICMDCELVALLEDDTGMELLVNKKIISLDLPVKDVYKKVWLPEHYEGEPMPVIYRMRGLLGDATEDMVNSLDSGSEEDEDKEEVYKMACVLRDCGGLEVMLERLDSIKDLVLGKQMIVVLLKLFSYAVNVKANRKKLIDPQLGSINIMLGALNLALWAEQEGATSNKGQTVTEQMLHIMEVVLLEASEQSPQEYTEFSKQCADKDQLLMMLDRINSPFVRANPSVLEALMRLVPFLAFGEENKMGALLTHFQPYLEFEKFDEIHSQDEEIHINCFCSIASAIESNANGIRLKDLILRHGMVQKAIDYIMKHAPEIKTMLATDSDVWKGFLSKPSLSFALRMLTGLCTKHAPTQVLIADYCIPVLHKLEQVSSDQHLGTLAENLLDALKTNPDAAKKIEEVRQQTKAEKKRLAMAVRKKQLGALGMTTNERGQVTVKSSVLKQMEDLKEETGLTCCICREGYRYQPQKVLAIYTYSRRCNLDDYEAKTRKSLGYSTVTHFNIIHVDCHTSAVRHARGREEWESAALQNANTRCNGLLPIWGPQVQESVFASCLARHNNYLQECTGIRDLNYTFNIHDMKLLLLRFAMERSFSEDSGGGGPQSNIHLIPFVMHMVLYAINTTRASSREEKNMLGYLEMPTSKWVDNSGEVEGILYQLVLAMHVLSPSKWKDNRVQLLKRLLITAHIRMVCPLDTQHSIPAVTNRTPRPYSDYKCLLVFFGMVSGFYDKVFMKVKGPETGGWSKALFEHIRQNDKAILELCDNVLKTYQEELLTCESFGEYVDVIGMLEDVPDPDTFLKDTLASIP